MARRIKITQLTPVQILKRSALVSGLVGTLLFGLSLKKIDRLPIDDSPLQFDGDRAYQDIVTLSKKFPNRTTWSDERRAATKWLKTQFRQMGYQPKGMLFSETIAGKEYTDLENVYVEKIGKTKPDEVVVVMGHYDITDTTTEGAMDDASGTAVVLELARVFAKIDTQRTIVFLATDSEEFGAFWGARAFAKTYPKAKQIVGAASFDFVAPEKQVAILTICDGLKEGYTPLWLRELALDSLKSVGGFEVRDFTHVVEFIQRAIQIPPADHGAFLAEGIPAFNWVGQNDNFARQMAHYHHTDNDVAEAIEPKSVSDYGRSAERFLRSIDKLNKIPENFRDSNYLKITQRFYIEGPIIFFLHILAFIPFILFSLSKFKPAMTNRRKGTIRRVLKNEAKGFGIVAGSFLIGYALLRMLPAFDIITDYEIFPATQKSELLSNPNFVAILLVFAGAFFVYWILSKTFEEPEDEVKALEIRGTFHAVILSLIVVLALIKNSHLAVLLLMPPAYLWPAVTGATKKKKNQRLFNALLILGGLLSFFLIIAVMGTVFHIGVIYWYIFLAVAYGLISAYAVVLFFIAISIAVRLFKEFVIDR